MMRAHNGLRLGCRAAAVILVVLIAGGCSAEPEIDANAPASTSTTRADGVTEEDTGDGGTGVPSSWEPDYANDAGEDIEEFEYPDDPEPAESIVRTLCNLNQEHFEGLRETVDGRPVVDDHLRTTLVGLSDLLGYWDTLLPHYPASASGIETARQIYGLWDEAVLSVDNGDRAAAEEAMTEAETLLEELPDDAPADCTT